MSLRQPIDWYGSPDMLKNPAIAQKASRRPVLTSIFHERTAKEVTQGQRTSLTLTTNMSIFFCCLLALLSSTALSTPGWPHPGGRLFKRDDFYPVHNPTDTCYDYEVLDNRGKSNAGFQPADTYPTVQGITRGRPNGNYWENP